MQAREYLPDIRRFLTQDRFQDAVADLGLLTDPLTHNRYAFVGGNPVTVQDFDGHEPPHGSYVNAPDDFYGESSMSPRARAAKRRRERLASSASGTTSPDAVDRNYRDPVQQLHDTSSQLLTQREVWARKIAQDRADHGAWDSFQNDAGGTFKGMLGFDFGIGRSESRTYQEEAAQWSSAEWQIAVTFVPGVGQLSKVSKGIKAGTSLLRAGRGASGGATRIPGSGLLGRPRNWRYGRTSGGAMGETDAFGNIVIRRGLRDRDLDETLRHERVHQLLRPRTRPLRRQRAQAATDRYFNSQLWRYLEEAAAEGYATRSLRKGLKHPFHPDYGISTLGLAREAGSIGIGGGVAGAGGYELLAP